MDNVVPCELAAAMAAALMQPEDGPERAGQVLARWLRDVGREEMALAVCWRAGLVDEVELEQAWNAGRDPLAVL